MEDFSSVYLPAEVEQSSVDRDNSQCSGEQEIVMVDSDNKNERLVEDSPVLSAGDCDFSIVVSHEEAHPRRLPKRSASPQNFKVSRTREYQAVPRASSRRTQPSPRPPSPPSSTPDTPPSESGSTSPSNSPPRHCHGRHDRTKRSVSGSRSTVGPCGSTCLSGLPKGAESCNHGGASMYESLPRTRRRTPCPSDQRSCCRPSDYSQVDCECCSEHAANLPGSYANLPPQISGRTPRLRHGGSLKIFRNVRMSHDLAREREVIDELSPDVFWNDSSGKHGQRHFSSHRRLELTALDSGEERMHAPYSRRPRDMGENRLGYSTGTGLDQLAIEELARSVTNLKSDIERLTLQQQSFMDSAAPRSLEPPIEGDSMNGQDVVANRPRPPRNLHSAQSVGRLHHSPNNKPMTPSTSRATWNARTSLRYPSQADMQSTNLGQANCELVPTGVGTTCDIPSPGESTSPPLSAFNLSNAAVQNGVQTAPTSLLAAEQFTEAREAASNSSDSKETTPIPESQRAPEQLFIAFEDPQSERLRRARERIEARIAAERRQNTEKTLRARHAKVEAQVIGEISHRQELDLRHEEEKSPDPSSNTQPAESLFPVHTTTFDSQPAATVVEASRPPSAVGVKKPAVASNRNPSAATSHTSRWSSSSAAQRGKAACSVSSSQAGSRVTSTNGSRRLPNGASGSGETEGSELETEDTEHKFATTPRHRSSSRQSIGKLSAGRSLSSLHRLTSGEDSAYSGPGLPVAGLPQTRLYAKPKPKSNRAVIVNAISHCCLAGTVNESIKKTTLQELAAVDGSHFIVLFRDSRCQYRALYAFDPESEDLHLISGSGPRKVIHKMVEKFFKYNSGLKQFTEITSTKHLSTVVDAITIQNNFWARNSSIATAAARGNLSQSINGGHP
uniref:Calmodulin-regulated spectrin-associated protein 1 n=1 Tax=Schistocephalus solidus TaxID=70667 RepID=A0A0X3P8L4_SCHSO